jgi:phosphoserine aminotransferase
MKRYNFSGGPGALPEIVLKEAQQAIIEVPDVGLSVLGISHRSDWFCQVVDEAENNLRQLLGLSASYKVIFLQGGGSLQFSMIPMAFLRGQKQSAEYLHTGYWSGKSFPDAQLEGKVRLLWQGSIEQFTRLPEDRELDFSPEAPYFHYVSNETVEGLQFHRVLGLDTVPRICDMSSDFLSRPIDTEKFSLIYAHAQKNLGPAGVTVVILREDLLEKSHKDLHSMLDYRKHIESSSIYNTPPVFSIYVVLLVTRWLMNSIGGLEMMNVVNKLKAECIYNILDSSDGFYKNRVLDRDRSLMNIAFSLPSTTLENKFLEESEEAGFYGLAGHRSIGGIRASLYNAVSLEAVKALQAFMENFRNRHWST